ncbi:MAG: cytochrome c peroxidase [Planctomycetota bacterium]
MFSASLVMAVVALALPAQQAASAGSTPEVPLGLPELPVPADNALTAAKVELGKQLFFDKRLSKDGSAACETCHLPELGWTDAKPFSTKVGGELNTRHTPTLWNVAYYPKLYWDGRAEGLEKQVIAAWKAQMGADPDAIAKKLVEVPAYKQAFEASFGGAPTADAVVKALACFVRTLLSGNSPWDRYEHGDQKAVSADAVAGFQVFKEAASCSLCHAPPFYTDTLFHNVGIGSDAAKPDLGRGKIVSDLAQKENRPLTADEQKLMGAFKTPGLRSITETGPYFHDGRFASLDDAVDFMLKGGIANPNLDVNLKAKQLSADQRRQLIEFLKSLTPQKKPFTRPAIP